MAFWQKTRHFGKITAFIAFDENHGFTTVISVFL